ISRAILSKWLVLMVILLVIVFNFFIFAMSYGILYIIDKRVGFLEFNLKWHRFYFGEHMYFLEFHSKSEKTNFIASFNRSIFGAVLVLGIGVLSTENFLTIPDLQPVFIEAVAVAIVTIMIFLPLIIIWLYISPLITKELNLYYFDKNQRTVKNVGTWMDNSLKFFAVIDIALTSIILVDSGLPASSFILISCLIILVFSLFLIFTIVFNRYYHTRLKNKFLEYLKGKYNLPIRKVSLFHRYYYCYACGRLTDAIQHDKCIYCGAKIHKCMICNEFLDIKNIFQDKKEEDDNEAVIDVIYELFGTIQTRLSGGSHADYPYINCPHCNEIAHVDEFISWIKMRGSCPSCKKKVDVFDLFTITTKTQS
ncbi:MAG: hypothetical protein ACTSRA_19850, partial [Promethearchaeota archaeon]